MNHLGISRLLLADREATSMGWFTETMADGRAHEQGVFGRGFDNNWSRLRDD